MIREALGRPPWGFFMSARRKFTLCPPQCTRREFILIDREEVERLSCFQEGHIVNEFLRASETASLCGVGTGTLAKWRLYGRGPRFCRAGRRILYARAVVLAWLQAHEHTSTSEYCGSGEGRAS